MYICTYIYIYQCIYKCVYIYMCAGSTKVLVVYSCLFHVHPCSTCGCQVSPAKAMGQNMKLSYDWNNL